jgi:2-keto-4-pentenoate hydratase/2-oxohepta-3-ene-1,7-dioic acid hydratase in catechol pathway
MKFVTFRTESLVMPGILTTDGRQAIPLAAVLRSGNCRNLTEFIENHTEEDLDALRKAAEDPALTVHIPVADIELLAPIPRPVHDILCVGVNYKSHKDEADHGLSDKELSELVDSIYFSKRASRITGPGETVHGFFELDPHMDYETELAVVIGKKCRGVKREEAESVIFGYSVFNDLSSRILQRKHKQWLIGKSLDGYAAMGPWIVTRDELPFPLELTLHCEVNGEERQRSNTRLMLNGVAGVIEDISAGITLEAGDIIATGTPSGVAMGMAEPKWLKPGDEVRCTIDGIGSLVNHIG